MTLYLPSRARPLVALVAAALAACAGEAPADRRADDATDAPPPAPAAAAPASDAPIAPAPASASAAADGDDCPMYGPWQRCSVIERLERAGFGVTALPDTARQPGLVIAGEAFRLGGAELQVYLYADSAGATRAAGALDADEAEPAATRGIRRAPAVIRSANLVALLFNNNDRQLERVQLALTAGLPLRAPGTP